MDRTQDTDQDGAVYAHRRAMRSVASAQRVLLSLLILLWLFYAFMVEPDHDHDGLDSDVLPPMTGPYLGPSTVGEFGVASTGRSVSEAVACVMIVLHLWAWAELRVRADGYRSWGVLLCGGANALLLAWSLFLVAVGHDAVPPMPGAVVVLGMFALWPWLEPLPRRSG